MKYGKLALILCLICTLLLAGCNKAPAETPQTPDEPAATAPPGSSGPSQPVTPPEPPVTPLQPPLTEEEEALLEAALLREEMVELVQNALTEGSFVIAAEPLPEYAYDWDVWGFRVKNGIRQPWRNIATITPDGKDFSLVLDDFGESAPAWVAVQNYRLLESDLTHGTGQLLENLGFDATYTGNVPEPTDILFTDFQAAQNEQGQVDENADGTHAAKMQQLHQHHGKAGNTAGAHVIGGQKQGKAQRENGTANNGGCDPAETFPKLVHRLTSVLYFIY